MAQKNWVETLWSWNVLIVKSFTKQYSALIGIYLNVGKNKLYCCVYCMCVCWFVDKKYVTARNE